MTMIDQAAARLDKADLLLLANVETIRDQQQPAHASAVASLIGGAPVRKVAERLARMHQEGLIEIAPVNYVSYQLTQFGCELLIRELIGWSPSQREQRRRDATLASAAAGAYRRG